MPAKKTAPPAPTVHNTGAHIENVNITNSSAANEHTRAAVEALAKAAEANARAISDIASGLKGSPASIGNGIYLSDLKGS